MKEKRKGCRKCGLYSASLGRCIKGKVNPASLKAAKGIAKFMGIGCICNVNGMQTKLIERR